MKQIPVYGDERTLGFCAFCGGGTGTRDHCPSRVFLDEPYPENLPVVPACSVCNAGFSEDEEYFACLVSCVIAGSTDPDSMHREKAKRILKTKPALRARIEQSRSIINGIDYFKPEDNRVRAVVTKLAQGHALYELHESCAQSPDSITYTPLLCLSEAQRHAFENPEPQEVWPEVGSRAMHRAIIGTDVSLGGWLDVQAGRYRFHASQGCGIDVRIVIHEYLACHVHWE
jgi:hypothetical protein